MDGGVVVLIEGVLQYDGACESVGRRVDLGHPLRLLSFLLPSFLLTMLVRTVPRNSVGSWGTMASRERKSRSPSRRMSTPSMAMAQGGIVASGSTSR